jgi:predicted secreted acid phosphatase
MKTGAILITALLIAAVPALAETTPTGKSAQEIREYYDSGDWNTAIAKQVAKAKAYLAKRVNGRRAPRKPALILDIDETALNNVVCLDAKNGIPYDAGIYAGCVIAYDAPAFKTVRSLYKRATRLGVRTFFVTGRPEGIREGTLTNLRAAGYKGEYELFLQPASYEKESKVPYKSGVRKRIQRRGYKILANVGDQRSDLKGGYSERTYKLPNPIYFTE